MYKVWDKNSTERVEKYNKLKSRTLSKLRIYLVLSNILRLRKFISVLKQFKKDYKPSFNLSLLG